jgi:hypothetical protein
VIRCRYVQPNINNGIHYHCKWITVYILRTKQHLRGRVRRDMKGPRIIPSPRQELCFEGPSRRPSLIGLTSTLQYRQHHPAQTDSWAVAPCPTHLEGRVFDEGQSICTSARKEPSPPGPPFDPPVMETNTRRSDSNPTSATTSVEAKCTDTRVANASTREGTLPFSGESRPTTAGAVGIDAPEGEGSSVSRATTRATATFAIATPVPKRTVNYKLIRLKIHLYLIMRTKHPHKKFNNENSFYSFNNIFVSIV